MRKLAVLALTAALGGFGNGVHAQTWSYSFSDMGVNYTIWDLTAATSPTQSYRLDVNTTGYTGPSTGYLDSVDFKGWSAENVLGSSLNVAPGGPSSWTGSNGGPITSGQATTTGCSNNGGGFACFEALTKGTFAVASGNPYTFLFTVTLNDASLFVTSSDGIHVGAGYADANGRGTGYGITSYATAPIPEPETYAMLLAGLALMGFVARRRQRNLEIA